MVKYLNDVIRILKKTDNKSMLSELSKNDPYYILISTILSQRNKDKNTIEATKNLFRKYKNINEIVNAPLSDVKKLIKKSGFFNVKSKRIKEVSKILLDNYNGKVPSNIDELIELPGVGRKTANCVLVYAYKKSCIPVDVHVNRLSNRLGLVKTRTPEQTEIELMKIVPKKYWIDINELFVLHGQNICKPISPFCSKCKIKKYCKRIGVGKFR